MPFEGLLLQHNRTLNMHWAFWCSNMIQCEGTKSMLPIYSLESILILASVYGSLWCCVPGWPTYEFEIEQLVLNSQALVTRSGFRHKRTNSWMCGEIFWLSIVWRISPTAVFLSGVKTASGWSRWLSVHFVRWIKLLGLPGFGSPGLLGPGLVWTLQVNLSF